MEFKIGKHNVKENWEYYQSKIDRDMPVKFEKLDKKDIKDTKLEDFIKLSIQAYNMGQNTIRVKSKTIQCTRGRRRSAGDIYKVCKYYYPGIKLEEVVKILYKFVTDEKINITTGICSTILKRIYYNGYGTNFHVDHIFDEFYRKPNDYYNENKTIKEQIKEVIKTKLVAA